MTSNFNISKPPSLFQKITGQFKAIKPWFKKGNMEKYQFFWLAAIMAPALLIAVWIFNAHSDTSTFISDNGAWKIASNLVKGYGYSACDNYYFPFCGASNRVTAMREPIPVFLMALARLIYPSHDAGLLMQTLLYLGTVPAIFAILKKEDIRLALIASLLWVFSVPVFNEMGNDNGHLIAALFYTAGMFFFLRGIRGQKTADFLMAGGLMGLAALSRTILMGTAVGIGLFLLGMQVIARNKKQLLNAVFFLGVIGGIMSPWMIRNQATLGFPIFGSTLTGYNIFRMNYYLGNEPFQPHYAGSEEAHEAIAQLIASSDLTGTENEAQMQDFYAKAGLEIILQYPLRYVELSLYRFLILWFDVGVNKAYGTKMIIRDYIGLIEQLVLLLAALFGSFKRYKEYWPLIISVVLGCGAYMAVNAQLRYLVDLMPSIVILSALSIPHLSFAKRIMDWIESPPDQ